MKVLFSSYKNPYFMTITEYIEKALNRMGNQVVFFDNRNFLIPGRIRYRIPYLNNLDLRRINKSLISIINTFKPDLFLEAGGYRIFPETIDRIKRAGINTVLWTIDPPRDFEPVLQAAPYYDFVFTGGSEAYDIFEGIGIKSLHWLPFACDPEMHKPVIVPDNEREKYSCDICFVGSYYPARAALFEGLSDLNLGIWGPGWGMLPPSSPLKRFIRGGNVTPDEWTKIYSASKIVLCMHYKDSEGRISCHQASPRVYETLACGAFLMVDAQKDVIRLFKDREELAVFQNVDELRQLITYYLNRPEERLKIAEAGRKSVLEKHTYKHRVHELLIIANQ